MHSLIVWLSEVQQSVVLRFQNKAHAEAAEEKMNATDVRVGTVVFDDFGSRVTIFCMPSFVLLIDEEARFNGEVEMAKLVQAAQTRAQRLQIVGAPGLMMPGGGFGH